MDYDNSDLDRADAAREDRWERQRRARQAIPYNHPDAIDLPDEDEDEGSHDD